MLKNVIEFKLNQAFNPEKIEVTDQTYMHSVPPDAESHFHIFMVSQAFKNQRLIQRHRAINNVLKEELSQHIHALSMHVYTPDEWLQTGEMPETPPCMGGEKP